MEERKVGRFTAKQTAEDQYTISDENGEEVAFGGEEDYFFEGWLSKDDLIDLHNLIELIDG